MADGLSLIANYSDSEDEISHSPPLQKKKLENPLKFEKKKLENPLKFVKIGVDLEERPEDDPSLHDFRLRSFPHVRGNWACHLYLEASGIDHETLQNSIVSRLALEEAKPIENPHISVSRVFTLPHHCLSSFNETLQEKLVNLKSPKALSLALGDELKIFLNEEKSRTFIALPIFTNKHLQDILECCDQTLLQFGKEAFYQPAEFHISLAWVLGNRKSQLELFDLSTIFEKWQKEEDSLIETSYLMCKMGNKLHRFRF